MVFNSATFLFFFLPITLVGSFVISKKYVNYFLLIMSIIFFSWGQINYLSIIVLNIVINYIFALLIEKYNIYKKILLIIAVTLNLLILIYFKYTDFLIETVNVLFKTKINTLKIILPVGISFFTFQGLSYTVDVYRNNTKANKNIFELALYIMLFPQLIAGPIVRYVDIEKELFYRTTSITEITYGIKRFIIGLSKKVIIANTLGYAVDSIYKNMATTYSKTILIACAICYMYQIYYDFSGYSDMAIGMGHMLGFRYKENFDHPYESKSITEFWRRWHISLSSFFKDYVYIPLGGKYKHVYRNLFIVFLLTGIWHGASVNFIIWGLWNALFIIVEKIITSKTPENIKILLKNNSILNLMLTIFKRIYTYLVILIGFIWFRCYDFNSAINYFQKLFAIIKPEQEIYNVYWYLDNFTILILILAIVFSFNFCEKIKNIMEKYMNKIFFEVTSDVFYLILFVTSIIFVYQDSYSPFIYFQF